MKFIVDNKHREFFANQGWIEFEHLLSQDKVYELRRAANEVLALRLAQSTERLSRMGRGEIVMKGRDLWRDSDIIKTTVCNRVYAEIASELVESTPLRLGYDQIFITTSTTSSPGVAPDISVPLLTSRATLDEISCIQGILCGLLLTLQGGTEQVSSQPALGVCPLPRKEGNGIFIAPETVMDFPKLLAKEGETHLLIVYCRAVTRYVLSPLDPHTHYLKNLEYSFGDRLVDQYHPVLFR